MKIHSKSIPKSTEILEALSESLSEIDSHFKKVELLKSMLEQSSSNYTPQYQNSYAAKYKKRETGHTTSLKTLPEVIKDHRKTSSKPNSKILPFKTFTISEDEETEYLIQEKLSEIETKSEKSKNLEKEIIFKEKKLNNDTKDLETLEKTKKNKKKWLERQIAAEFCKNILYDIIVCINRGKIERKNEVLQEKKTQNKEKMMSLHNSIQELEKLKINLRTECKEYNKNILKLQEKETEIDKLIEKLSKNAKTLQNCKRESTLKVKEDQIRLKENSCLERLKLLNQKKTELEYKEQKLELREKQFISQKSLNKPNLADESPARQKKLLNKENALKEQEDKLVIEEQEVEEKRKDVMQK